MQAAAVTSKGAATRDSIIERAVQIVRKEGFEGLSIGTIAESVGMSKSGVFAHFGSREDLQLAVLDAAAQRFTEQVFLPAIREKRGLTRLLAIGHRLPIRLDLLAKLLTIQPLAPCGLSSDNRRD